MDVERLPGQPDQPAGEDTLEIHSGRGKGGGELFGDAAIPPSIYHCPEHGDVLAQDVLWKRDGRPYCPMCGAPLDSGRD